MRRWTDGKSWSASRVSGSFLTYREMEGKRGGGSFAPPPARRMGKTPESGRGSDEDLDMDGEGPDGYRYKPDGLMKQSFSITTSTGQHLHLISYYSRPHPNSPELPQPTTDPQLRHIVPVKGMYPESTVHETPGPAVTRTPMQHNPYVQSPQQMYTAHQQQMQQHHHQRGPQQYGNGPNYAWPPSPMNTPPFQSQPYPASVYGSSLPPPPHQSPYQQQGSAHNSPYQNQHPSPHQQQNAIMGQHPQQQTVYDRPPPPLSDSSLPPPPSGQHRGLNNQMPTYAPNPSPRVAQARLVAQQQALAQRALQAAPMLDPRLTNSPPRSLPPPQSNGIARTTTPPMDQANSQVNTPQSNGRASPAKETPKSNGTTQAQQIPSISSLVHATDSVSVMSDNKSNSSRAGSRSPKENGEKAKANDIPHDKLNIQGEDQRAISILDRKFKF